MGLCYEDQPTSFQFWIAGRRPNEERQYYQKKQALECEAISVRDQILSQVLPSASLFLRHETSTLDNQLHYDMMFKIR